MCHSLDNSTLSDALQNKGVKSIFGWQEIVSVWFAGLTKERLIDELIDNHATTGDAFNAVPHVDTATQPNAVLKLSGATDMTLPQNLVSNGSFETGDFTGWMRITNAGCQFPAYGGPLGPYSAVVSGNSTQGQFAGRLGRFDQVYAGGSSGPPAPGAEPCGDDIIYQDIQLPDTNSITLSFSYNLQTFDAGIWDWFDANVKDPVTGATIASIVLQAGKPGSQYGTYWNGGWQTATYDLSALKGRKIRLFLSNHQDGWGDQSATWLDQVVINCH